MSTFPTLARTFAPRYVRNWLRSPAKSLRYLRDQAAFAVGRRSVVQIAEAWSVKCHPAAYLYFSVFKHDLQQLEELESFFAHACSGMQLLDVGAHYGLFALATLRVGGPKARVVCIEPSAKALRVLRSNLQMNGGSDSVTVIEAALGDRDGDLAMLTTGPSGGDYFIVPAHQRSDTVRVRARSMISILNETHLTPTHIKIDIEGYELEVIGASVERLRQLRPILFLELHGTLLRARGKDPSLVISLLRSAGYTAFVSGGITMDDTAFAERSYNCRLVCLQ